MSITQMYERKIAELNARVVELEEAYSYSQGQVQYLVDAWPEPLAVGGITFPDGDFVAATVTEPEVDDNTIIQEDDGQPTDLQEHEDFAGDSEVANIEGHEVR